MSFLCIFYKASAIANSSRWLLPLCLYDPNITDYNAAVPDRTWALAKEETAQVKDTIERYFELAKNKNLESLQDFFSPSFHKFGDTAPFERREADRALMLEQLQFASISDFDFVLHDMRIENLGTIAVATFLLESTGIVVDDYSFRGAAVKSKSRVTMVFVKERGTWKMLHQHMSRFKD